MDDATTFFLAFAAVFAGIAAVLLHLERRARALEDRLAALEATTAKAKGRPEDGRPRA